MIIYGTKTKQLNQSTSMEKCNSCGQTNTVDLFVLQRYLHIFWIPFIPLGKTVASQCSHCKEVLKRKQMSPSLQLDAVNLKSQTKTPLYTFIGAALVVILFSFVAFEARQSDARDAQLVQQPQVNDIYEVRVDGNYTLYKVTGVSGDTAFISLSRFESNKATALTGLLSKPFTEDEYIFTIKELVAMQQKGDIMAVIRK